MTAAELSIAHVRDPGRLDALREEWTALFDAAASPSPFLSWEWLATWWRRLGGRRRLWVVEARDRVPPVFGEVPAGASPLFYPLLCDDKPAVQARLAAKGIETVDFWRDGHPRCPAGAFPEVDALRRRVLELPVHQDLDAEDMAFVARAAREALG